MLVFCSCDMRRDIDVSCSRAVEVRHSSLHEEYALVYALLQFMAVPPTCGKTPLYFPSPPLFFCEIGGRKVDLLRFDGVPGE